MATTINAANISIGMDISKLKDGMGATRSEISKIGSILRETEEPASKFQREMDLMRRALEAGGVTAEQYANAQEKLAKKYGIVTPAMERAAEEARQLAQSEAEAANAAKAIEADMARLAVILKDIEPATSKFERDMQLVSQALSEGKLTVEQYEAAQEKLAARYGIVTPAMQRQQLELEAIAASERKAKDDALQLAAAEKQREAQLARGKQLTDSVRTSLEIYDQKIDEYRESLRAGTITMETYNRLVRNAHLEYEKAETSANQLTTAIQKQKAAASGGGVGGFLGGQMQNMLAAGAGMISVSALANVAQEFDAIADKADQLGISYKDLMVIGKTLEESGGISFDQAGQAISKMQVNLANARDKGGELDAQLKKMGLSAAELANMDAVTAFQEISGAFGQITNQADRMQFATQLFGKAGIDMVPALEIGAQKYAEMQTHLEESGVLNQELAVKMGEAADAGGRLLNHMKGVGMFLVGEALPLMQGFLKLIEDSGKGWKNLRDSIQGVVMQGDAIDQALGITYDSEMIEKMTKAEYDAWVESNARRRVAYIQEQKAAEERRKIEQEINDRQQEVLNRMDGIIEQRRKERAEELAAIEKGRDSTLSALRAKSEGNKKAIVDEADVKRAVEEQIQLEQRKLAMDLASIYATRDKDSKEAQELEAKAREESANRVKELQDEGVRASQAISDQNRMKEIEKSGSSLEAERQRLLGAGDKNVAATIAPAIKAGTVEAYKAVNQQNEERAARHEQMKRLDIIGDELKKLNSEKAVLLTRIR